MSISRIAKNPVDIPTGVEVKLAGQTLNVKGKLGALSQDIHPVVTVKIEDNTILFP